MKTALIVLLGFSCLASADEPKSGRYQLASDSQGGVWRIDTTNGDVWKCFVVSRPICIQAGK